MAAGLRLVVHLFADRARRRAPPEVIIARAIRIENYGRYALLLTISLLTPLVGLQLLHTIIYFVSR